VARVGQIATKNLFTLSGVHRSAYRRNPPGALPATTRTGVCDPYFLTQIDA
jgi:hypothetical protein